MAAGSAPVGLASVLNLIPLCLIYLKTCLATLMGGAKARAKTRRTGCARQWRTTRQLTLRYNLEINLTEAYLGKTAHGARSFIGFMRHLQRLWRKARHTAQNLWHMQWCWCCAFAIRLLHSRTRLPHLRWARPSDQPILAWPVGAKAV